MNFNALHFEKLVQALSLTLIHSLWQGLIAAVLAGLILILTKKAKPALRYNLLTTLLFAFVLAASYTFFHLLLDEKQGVVKHGSMVSAAPAATGNQVMFSQSNAVAINDKSAWIANVMDFCSRNAQLIVTVWFIIFAFKSVQATAGFLYLQKVKKRNTHPLRESWKHRFDILTKKLKIKQFVLVIESEHVLVPMVIGFLKPMVIIPFGIFANLPESQIEAIILHELAHIKRRDYLVNLIQIFCENVFFFNPALLWLSSLIKEEREHCCDDLAISVMENKTSFVHALVSFQEYNVNGAAFEMAFSKKRNHLLDRIKRIIYNNNKPLNAMEKLFVTISLLTAVALSAAIPQDAPQPSETPVAKAAPKASPAPATLAKPEQVVVFDQDTLPKKKKDVKGESAVTDEVEVNANTNVSVNMDSNSSINVNGEGINTYSITTNGKHYEMVTIGKEMKILRIDGKEIPEEQFKKYESEVTEVKAEIKKAQEESEGHRWKADQHRKAAEADRLRADKRRVEADGIRQQADAQRQSASAYKKQSEGYNQQADISYADAEKQRRYGEQQKIYADKQRESAGIYREKAENEREASEIDRAKYEAMQESVINDLIESGATKSRNNLSYKFNKDELIVNGVTQPAALHQKLKEKYMTGKAFEMSYNFSSKPGSTATGILFKE
jgi:beta-lactamase regulating signal transducer with metallopeptidase domain